MHEIKLLQTYAVMITICEIAQVKDFDPTPVWPRSCFPNQPFPSATILKVLPCLGLQPLPPPTKARPSARTRCHILPSPKHPPYYLQCIISLPPFHLLTIRLDQQPLLTVYQIVVEQELCFRLNGNHLKLIMLVKCRENNLTLECSSKRIQLSKVSHQIFNQMLQFSLLQANSELK